MSLHVRVASIKASRKSRQMMLREPFRKIYLTVMFKKQDHNGYCLGKMEAEVAGWCGKSMRFSANAYTLCTDSVTTISVINCHWLQPWRRRDEYWYFYKQLDAVAVASMDFSFSLSQSLWMEMKFLSIFSFFISSILTSDEWNPKYLLVTQAFSFRMNSN